MRLGDPMKVPHFETSPLASGELSARDAAELETLKRRIEETVGLRCSGYKEKCLRRRIAVRMRARQVHRYADYAALLECDREEATALIDTVTINVSKFFRNPEVWEVVATRVIPALAELDEPSLGVWSAGSAAGEEIYSFAILLLEHAERAGIDPRRFRLLATDVDGKALADASRGQYGAFAFADISPERRERWFEGPDRTRLRRDVRDLVEFRRHDLIADPYPQGQHFILCRNVVIYFERAAQQQVFRGFQTALAPGGWLLLGKVEALFGEELRAFRIVASRERLFQKP